MAQTSNTSTFQAPPLSNETIENRLETGAHGSRASLTKCAVRYRSFLENIHAEQPSAEAIEESKQLLENELSLYKVEFHKLALRVRTYQNEVEDLVQESKHMTQRIDETKHQVETLRQELQQTKKVFGYKEEYEALAKMANHRPSRAILEKRLLLSQKQLQACEEEQASLQHELELRQKQFHVLMQCMLDLKASVEGDSGIESSSDGQGKEDATGGENEYEEGAVPMDTSTTL